MHIHSGSLYWPSTYFPTPIHSFQRLENYEAIIVGGGMSGALTAWALMNKGLKVAILDKRQVATGSTSANTGLLQYSNDIMLHELIEQIGEKNAVDFYRLCLEAMEDLREIADRLPENVDFISRSSIYYASDSTEEERLLKEYRTLRKYGFPCEYWDKHTLLSKTGIDRTGAIITHGDAEVNPFAFAHGIFKVVQKMGAHIFEFTEVLDVHEQNGKLHIQTSEGDFQANNVIFTTGYETLPVGKRIGADINRSYVIVTNPLDSPPWYNNALIWETKRPYLYMRTTADGRIIIGGLDENTGYMPPNEERIMERGVELNEQLKHLFPELTVSIDYSYCATFGESLDNLPFIGEHPKKRGHYYLLGYGGNGTVYSMIGATILADSLTGKKNPYAHIVALDRVLQPEKDGRTVVQ